MRWILCKKNVETLGGILKNDFHRERLTHRFGAILGSFKSRGGALRNLEVIKRITRNDLSPLTLLYTGFLVAGVQLYNRHFVSVCLSVRLSRFFRTRRVVMVRLRHSNSSQLQLSPFSAHRDYR